jgi:hypothetical protein
MRFKISCKGVKDTQRRQVFSTLKYLNVLGNLFFAALRGIRISRKGAKCTQRRQVFSTLKYLSALGNSFFASLREIKSYDFRVSVAKDFCLNLCNL